MRKKLYIGKRKAKPKFETIAGWIRISRKVIKNLDAFMMYLQQLRAS